MWRALFGIVKELIAAKGHPVTSEEIVGAVQRRRPALPDRRKIVERLIAELHGIWSVEAERMKQHRLARN